jgi:hypothetical protein
MANAKLAQKRLSKRMVNANPAKITKSSREEFARNAQREALLRTMSAHAQQAHLLLMVNVILVLKIKF